MTSDHSDPANAPLLGQVVAERYFVEKHLGEGGMGTVYRARHITLDKLVALKVLHGEFSRKQELVDRFLQEAKAASRIRNAHVIDITDFGVTGEGFVFFAMEYLEGKDLHGLLKEFTAQGGLVPWDRALDIFLQVCEALAAAHAEGIIHRDLKPENIFLVDGVGRSDYVKLLDFGIAKVETTGDGEGERKLTKTGMLFGTPEYMAPEQARGEKPDHRVDVYAMGCMLFQFLTGTVPFKAESFMAVLTQHMIEPVPEISPELLARSGAPIEILAVVRKALEKDREKRYGSMVELAAGVFDASSGQATSAAPATGGVRNRISRPTYSAGDWTGAVRHVDDIEEDEIDAVIAQEARQPRGGKWLIAGLVGAVLVGGALTFALLGGDEEASAREATTEVSDPGAGASANSPTSEPPPPTAGSTEPAQAESASAEALSDTRAPASTSPARESKQPVQTETATPIPSHEPAGLAPAKGQADAPATPKAAADKAPVPEPAGSEPTTSPDPKVPKEKTPGDESPGEPSLMRPPEFGS